MSANNPNILPVIGSYILGIYLDVEIQLTVGKLGELTFPRGYYAYVGSALGGLPSRLKRHLRQEKKIHWHIDYFLLQAVVDKVIVCDSMDKIECNIARLISSKYHSISGFGSSDCSCPSHLFYSSTDFTDDIMALVDFPDTKPALIAVERIRNLTDG